MNNKKRLSFFSKIELAHDWKADDTETFVFVSWLCFVFFFLSFYFHFMMFCLRLVFPMKLNGKKRTKTTTTQKRSGKSQSYQFYFIHFLYSHKSIFYMSAEQPTKKKSEKKVLLLSKSDQNENISSAKNDLCGGLWFMIHFVFLFNGGFDLGAI